MDMNKSKKRVYRINVNDNVATSLANIEPGQLFYVISKEGKIFDSYKSVNRIPFGFKIALKNINIDDSIVKYGYKIGNSFKNIRKGEMVHIHNIKSNRIELPVNRRKAMIDMLEKEKYIINWIEEFFAYEIQGF